MVKKFQLTIIAKNSVDIEDVINPPARPELTYPIQETAEPSEIKPVGLKKKNDTKKHYKPTMNRWEGGK